MFGLRVERRRSTQTGLRDSRILHMPFLRWIQNDYEILWFIIWRTVCSKALTLTIEDGMILTVVEFQFGDMTFMPCVKHPKWRNKIRIFFLFWINLVILLSVFLLDKWVSQEDKQSTSKFYYNLLFYISVHPLSFPSKNLHFVKNPSFILHLGREYSLLIHYGLIMIMIIIHNYYFSW